MTDDRSLLERAAKAAGIDVRWHEPWETHVHVGEWYEGRPLMHKEQMVWNPLTDDGDALRLAVKLNLHIGIDAESAGAISVEWGFDAGGNAAGCIEQDAPIGGDDYAATRRAIVRAAAALAKDQE
jgi:hypothetical protein